MRGEFLQAADSTEIVAQRTSVAERTWSSSVRMRDWKRKVPRIGIVSNFDQRLAGYFCNPAYIRAIESAGGLPVLIPYVRSPAHLIDVLSIVDGLVLTGGDADIDPQLYGESTESAIQWVLPERDAFEIPLIRAALERDLPMLGICRGLQSLNVAAGGSLYQDILSSLPKAANHRVGMQPSVHSVCIASESRLAAACGTLEADVNSYHHQAVNKLGSIFHACAVAPDGIVEAIESTQHRFVIGVQWHPERIWESVPACRRLFASFVAACSPAGHRGGSSTNVGLVRDQDRE